MLDRETLEAMLAEGLSLEQISGRVGCHSSTVSYWVRKHGLIANGAALHASRGGLERDVLEGLIAQDLSVREIAERVDRSVASVRHWLKRYGLATTTNARRAETRLLRQAGICPTHGPTQHFARADGRLGCIRCRSESVVRSRQEAKRRLIEEAGGACALCGYARCQRALHFHHRDPSQKRFGLSNLGRGISLAALREEAAKCLLLCSNCHMEVESGISALPD
jgi:transposase